MGWRDTGITLSVLIISCWQGAASNCIGQVQPINLFTFEEWRLDMDEVNSALSLALLVGWFTKMQH